MVSGERAQSVLQLSAGTRSHRVKLWQLKCRFEVRMLFGCRIICSTHGLFEFELRSPSLEEEG